MCASHQARSQGVWKSFRPPRNFQDAIASTHICTFRSLKIFRPRSHIGPFSTLSGHESVSRRSLEISGRTHHESGNIFEMTDRTLTLRCYNAELNY